MQAQILTFIIPAIALIFTAVFGALWWNDRRQMHVLAYSFCYGTMTVGTAINIWIFEGLDPVGVVVYHLLSMAGMLALLWGAAGRAEVKPPIIVCAVATVGSSAFLYFAVVLELPDAMRMAQNTSSALIISLSALTLWFGKKHNWADNALIWVLALLASFGFIRPMMTLFAPAVLADSARSASILTSIHVLVLATLLTLMALCLVASLVLDTMQRQRDETRSDPLSGLPLRAAFEEETAHLLWRAQRSAVPVSLIVGDIDHFKRINDGWGHSTGDMVITNVGRTIKRMVRSGDAAGRIGGEEFCILVWNCRLHTAARMAERLRLAIAGEDGGEGAGGGIVVTMSFGVAELNGLESYQALFERADKSLYRAKDRGRNRVILEGKSFEEADRRTVMQPTIPVHG